MNIHEKYINRCIELAKNGLGNTYPNPMVGSVIVIEDRIIGEGWHQKAGEPHAEVMAIRAVKDKSRLKESTIYVNLEPCSHVGRTPPCANLIVESGIKSVVIGSLDTYSEVNGTGIEHLRKNGCNVSVGVLEKECLDLNKRFFTYNNIKRPYILLKWAETKDGFIDKIRNETDDNTPNWISNSYSQQLVHKMRSEEQAILVGTTTVLNDNPGLTVRKWEGSHPVRVVIDKTLKISSDYKIYDGAVKTIFLTEKQPATEVQKNIVFEKVNFGSNLPKQLCAILFKHEIQSVIIEGGARTLQSFIDENLWDSAFVFVGDTLFKEGLKAPQLKKEPLEIQKISNDCLKVYVNERS